MTEDHRRQMDIAKEATDRMLKGATAQHLKDKQNLTDNYESRISKMAHDHDSAIEKLLTEQKAEMTRILKENLEFKRSYELDAKKMIEEHEALKRLHSSKVTQLSDDL